MRLVPYNTTKSLCIALLATQNRGNSSSANADLRKCSANLKSTLRV
uniref:Uncharacterized protein n=1 Tax=Arundo donax TaxID=35708 RepID=A0A0A9GS05_ARUDO